MLNVSKIKTFILLFSLIACSTFSHAQTTEKLAINKQGIRVWTYQKENNPIMQYRAETILDTSLENAVGLVLDTGRGKTWIPYVSELKILDQDNQAGRFVIYMQMDFPFPLKDRDLVVNGQLTKNNNGIIMFKNKSTKDMRVPVRDNIVRISEYEGDWTFQKLNAQQVKVTTSGYADPAGAIPRSFVNSFVQQQPYQMLQRMKQQVKKTNYTAKDLPAVLR